MTEVADRPTHPIDERVQGQNTLLPMIRATVELLTVLQTFETRNFDLEDLLAKFISDKAVEGNSSDFNLHLNVRFRTATVWSVGYLPKAWSDKREDLREYSDKVDGAKLTGPIPTTIKQSAFSGFHRGDRLGYPELENNWYLVLSASGGTYIIPVNSLTEIVGGAY